MKIDNTELSSRLELAVFAARRAGEVTLDYFCRSDLAVEQKADKTPVTKADRRAEQLLREMILEAYPEDSILGEEFPEQKGSTGFKWILDPIDGTKSFIHGVPLYGVLVGMEFRGHSVLGVIRIPALQECVYAAKGHGAWYVKGHEAAVPAHVSKTEKLEDALLLTSELASFDSSNRRDAFEKLHKATKLTRTWGDCYGYMLVATGRADVMVDPVLNVWDAAALLPILQEAGGTYTDWVGRPSIHSGEGIATNNTLLPEVLDLVKGF